MTELKEAVAKILIGEYDFDQEEAWEEIETSFNDDYEDIWHANADPKELAKLLANEGSSL